MRLRVTDCADELRVIAEIDRQKLGAAISSNSLTIEAKSVKDRVRQSIL